MAKYIVTTRTGSVYYIDRDRDYWAKNYGGWEPLTFLAEGEWDGDHTRIPDIDSWPEVEVPEVGKNMYISGRGMYDWWLSTPIVSVEVSDKEGDDWPWV